MNVKDVNLDELMKIDDQFLMKWISKDITTGRHFCYLEIDKRTLTETFANNEEEMLAMYCHQVAAYAGRYARISFEPEYAAKLELQLLNVRMIKETYEEAEDTTWLVYEFVYAYVATNEKGEKYFASNASFLNYIKSDYTPRVLAEKIQSAIPDLKDMQVGEVRSMGADALKKAMDIIKEETHESDAS